MSGHPQGGQYDDGYGHGQQGQNAYYHDDQYGGQYHDDQRGGYQDNQHGDAYYDESYVLPSPQSAPAAWVADCSTVPITMASTASINKTATMTIVGSRVTKTNITTISIMTKVVPQAAMARTAMGEFHPEHLRSAVC